MSSKQLNFLPCSTQLEGFCHFAYHEAWIPPPAKAAALPGQGGSQAPLQSCSSHALRAAALQAAPCLLPCSTEDVLMGERCPLGHLTSQGLPLLPREPLGTVLRGELQPSLNSAGLGAQAPAEDEFLLILSFLFFSLLSQVWSTGLALEKHCELIRNSSEGGVHLPAPSYSQNKPKLLGQLPQSLLPSLPLLFPSKHCSHFNIKALYNPFIPFFSSSFKLTSFKSAPALFAHLHLVVNKEKGAALLLGTKGCNFEQLPCGSCLVRASLGFPTQGRLCMWPFKLNLLHMFSGSANWTSDLTTIQWV